MRSLFALLIVATLIAASPASANDPQTGLLAGNVVPLKSEPVALEREDLGVLLSPDDVDVDATLVLHNRGAARDLTLGMPYFTADDRDRDWNYDDNMEAFTCRVDGQLVQTSTGQGPTLPRHGFKSTTWQTWTVHFAAGQTRTVFTHFRGQLGVSYGNASYPKTKRAVAMLDYMLSTARGWKAPIGHFHLTVRTIAPLKLSDVYAVSLPVQRDHNALVWDVWHLRPQTDLKIQVFGELQREPASVAAGWWINPAFHPRRQ